MLKLNRGILAAALFAATLTIAGCGTIGGTVPGPDDVFGPDGVSNFEAGVEDGSFLFCSTGLSPEEQKDLTPVVAILATEVRNGQSARVREQIESRIGNVEVNRWRRTAETILARNLRRLGAGDWNDLATKGVGLFVANCAEALGLGEARSFYPPAWLKE